MRIDHVTIAGSQLRRMAEALRAFGLESWYGGTHSNGVTEMSLIGFQDSSYLELISVVPGRGPSPWWNPHIQQNAGLAGWAVVVDDIPSVLGAVASRGVTVRGPRAMHRVRPDGRRAEWNLALLGDGEPGGGVALSHPRPDTAKRTSPGRGDPNSAARRRLRDRRSGTGGEKLPSVDGVVSVSMERSRTSVSRRDPPRRALGFVRRLPGDSVRAADPGLLARPAPATVR